MDSSAAIIRRFFVRKYTLPPTHPTFLARSDAEWLEEMYEDLYVEKQGYVVALDALGDATMDAKARTQERMRLTEHLKRVCEQLGEVMPEALRDDLLDDLDAKLAAGEEIDLQQLMPKGWRPPA